MTPTDARRRRVMRVVATITVVMGFALLLMVWARPSLSFENRSGRLIEEIRFEATAGSGENRSTVRLGPVPPGETVAYRRFAWDFYAREFVITFADGTRVQFFDRFNPQWHLHDSVSIDASGHFEY